MSSQTTPHAELICGVSTKGSMQLRSLSASEGLSKPFEYQIEILNDKADLDLAKFLGTSMTVSIPLPEGGTRHFNGLVASFRHSGERTKQYFHYTATVRPWFWFLSHKTDCRIFQDMTVVEIIDKVFSSNHGSIVKLRKRLSATYAVWPYCVQYRETDLNCVSRLLEREGIYYYFEHTSSGHEMVLCDSMSAHSAVPHYETVPYAANWAARDDALEAIKTWSVGVQVLTTKVELTDYDFERPSRALSKKDSVPRAHALNSYEAFDYPGEYAQDGDGQAYAKAYAQELQARYHVASGHTDARGMTFGHTFKAKHLPDASLDGEYLVVSTQVYLKEGVQIGGEDGGRGEFSCTFTALPTSDVFRAPRQTPKPMVYGPQTAVVVGPAGQHIHTDKYGRIKVYFHWDRWSKAQGGKTDKNQCWVRVSQPWAGKGFGAISLPRIGVIKQSLY